MKTISVIGSGTMGNGISHVCALKGYQVNLIDVNQDILDKALATITKNLDRQMSKNMVTAAEKDLTLHNISLHVNMEQAISASDLVIEAVPEIPEIKAALFRKIDESANPSAIIASNTSSISITKIAAFTRRPDKVIGMHFMNPVPVMKLVEVIRGYETSDETASKIMDLSLKLGKVPVEVNDYPGFISNRILMPMINEAIYALYEGVAGVREIDTVMKLGMAHPMGPLQLADFIGLDVCYSILQILHTGFGNPKYAPCPLLANMVAAGNLGIKTGTGFYQYSADNKEMIPAKKFTK